MFDSNLLVNFLLKTNYLQNDICVTLNIIYMLFEHNRFNKDLSLQFDENAIYECVFQFNNGFNNTLIQIIIICF